MQIVETASDLDIRSGELAGLISPLGTIDDTVGGDTSRYSLSGRWHRDVGDQQRILRLVDSIDLGVVGADDDVAQS